MDILKETVDAVVNSRFPEMSKEGRQQLAEVLIRKNVNKGEIILNEGQIAHDFRFPCRQLHDSTRSDICRERYGSPILL